MFLIQSFNIFISKSLFYNSLRYLRHVAKTEKQYFSLKNRKIEQPQDAKLLRVSIIGSPNAGKSTLMNEIIHWRVSSVSKKVHTTNKNVVGVLSHNDTQIEFLDTPGLVSGEHIKRHHLNHNFRHDPANSLKGTDIITVVVDISNKREQFHINKGILKLLSLNRDKESILVLNKIDKIKNKKKLIDFTNALTSGIVNGQLNTSPERSLERLKIEHGNFEEMFEKTERLLSNKEDIEESLKEDGIGWPNFSSVFMVSALENDGVSTLSSYLMSRATRRPWLYNKDFVTTLPPRELTLNALREVCLENLNQEIPYKIKFEILMWQLDELDNLNIVANLYCPERFQSFIIGPKGANISIIVRKCRETLCNIFHCDVSLKLGVKPLKSKQ